MLKKESDLSYTIYQSIIKAAEENDYDALKESLTKIQGEELSSCMNTSLKILEKHLTYIKNTFGSGAENH